MFFLSHWINFGGKLFLFEVPNLVQPLLKLQLIYLEVEQISDHVLKGMECAVKVSHYDCK